MMDAGSNSDLDILVVDDDKPIRNLVRQVVKRIGYPAREAVDGEDAIRSLDEQLPDLLILDLMMPRVSGWDVLDWLEENGKLESLPVVVLTAMGTNKTETLEKYDVQAVISKPFEITSLTSKLREIIEST